MSNEKDFEAGLNTRIDRALELRREVVVPEAFAGRVMQSLPPRRRRRAAMRVGRLVAIFAAMVLALTMFALAPESRPNVTNFAFDMELLMLAQLAGIAWWLGGRADSRQ